MIEENKISPRPTASRMRAFIFIWLGQLVSIIGSGLTSFALGVWVYQRTGSVTQFTLIFLCTTLPVIVISPIAGAFVDRWDRRWTMLLSDLGAGGSILVVALMLFAGRLEVWHIYLATSANSICRAFQWPAYAAATTLLVPKQHLSRASGLVNLGQSLAQLISPVLAGVLIVVIQLQGVILLDFATFLFALVTLLSVRFPEAKTTDATQAGKGSLLREAAYGWTYITARPGLLGLLIFLATSNFLVGIVGVLATPLVLSFASAAVLGTVLSIGGSGMVVGSLVMSTWGGTQRLINSVFGFMLLSGLCILVAGLRPSAPLFAVAAFLFFFGQPMINGSSQAILQKKVVPDVQGRIFALTGTITGSSLPLAYLLAGPLADHVFEPLLAPGGPLAGSIGQLIGVGRGRGIGLMFIIMGALTMLATVVAYQYPRLRLVESELPDAIATVADTPMELPDAIATVADEPMQVSTERRVKKRTPWLIGLVAAGLLGTTTAAYLAVRGTTRKPNITNLTVAVASKNLTLQIKTNGVVQAVRKINLSPKDSGQIAKLYVDEGSLAKQGKLVARMDSEQLQAQVNQYKAVLAKAEADLAQKRAGSRPEEIAKAKAEVDKNEAQVVAAESTLELTNERVKRKQGPTEQGAISRDQLEEALTEQRNSKASLEQAKAGLAVARQALAILLHPYRPEEIAQAEANVAQAKAQLQYYEIQLQNTYISAPFTGTITRRFAQEGDFVTPTTSASSSDGATSASIAELSSGLEVEAKVPEASIAQIKPGQQTEIRSDAYPDMIFLGCVRWVAPIAVQENNVTSFRVKVILKTDLGLLKPGMNVKLTFKGNEIENAMVVPLAAIVTKKDGQTGVLVPDENNQAKFRPVTVGVTSGDKIQILSGVSKGERIFIRPPADQKIEGVDTVGF